MTKDIQDILQALIKFRDERNWGQFHNAKDLSLALSIEAAELNELFLWKDPADVDLKKLKEELADVFAYAFLLAEKHNFDVKQIILDKVSTNAGRYPVSRSKDNAKKYSDP